MNNILLLPLFFHLIILSSCTQEQPDPGSYQVTVELICNNNEDDDDDGAIDCNDTDCVQQKACITPINLCGNGEIDPGEDCDGSEPLRSNCIALGFNGGGTLKCSSCKFDPSECKDSTISNSSGSSRGRVEAQHVEYYCLNGKDDDGDSKIDKDDSDCASVKYNDNRAIYNIENDQYRCSDGVDNDGIDGIDCADPKCASIAPCSPGENCTNCKDDNNDGKVDCLDPLCVTTPFCSTIGGPTELCFNGLDDDLNGLSDCADLSCNLVVSSCNSLIVCARENAVELCRDTIPKDMVDTPFDNDGAEGANCDDPKCQAMLRSECVQCLNDAACNDNDPCTLDTCDRGARCKNTPIINKAGCCDPANTLDPRCDDNQPCTVEFCDANGACQVQNVPKDQICIAVPTCAPFRCNGSGACLQSSPSDEINKDICLSNIDTECQISSCDPNDTNADELTGCITSPIQPSPIGGKRCCDEDADCNPDNNPCIISECDEKSGQCKPIVNKPLNTDCDDGKAPLCRKERCDGNGNCSTALATFDNELCESITPDIRCYDSSCNPNGDPDDITGCRVTSTGQPNCCTTDENCAPDTGPNAACTTSTCTVETGECRQANVENNTICDSTPFCQPKICTDGQCVDSTKDDSKCNLNTSDCNFETCVGESFNAITGCQNNIQNGICLQKPDDQCGFCNPDDARAGLDGCVSCDDGFKCTSESCSTEGFGSCLHTPDNNLCLTPDSLCRKPPNFPTTTDYTVCDPSSPLRNTDGCRLCLNSQVFGSNISGTCIPNNGCEFTEVPGNRPPAVSAKLTVINQTTRQIKVDVIATEIDFLTDDRVGSITVYWGDGSFNDFPFAGSNLKQQSISVNHTYSAAGTYTISIFNIDRVLLPGGGVGNNALVWQTPFLPLTF